jgi:hypothetical protein
MPVQVNADKIINRIRARDIVTKVSIAPMQPFAIRKGSGAKADPASPGLGMIQMFSKNLLVVYWPNS